eukprot:GCRY01004813.1.p1 GENE.GCRY01004813.1~~GCRY01004813.1.p1  ORF type:complete len:651 (+),score=63.71 GCRY01004813.1:63-2015(+)
MKSVFFLSLLTFSFLFLFLRFSLQEKYSSDSRDFSPNTSFSSSEAGVSKYLFLSCVWDVKSLLAARSLIGSIHSIMPGVPIVLLYPRMNVDVGDVDFYLKLTEFSNYLAVKTASWSISRRNLNILTQLQSGTSLEENYLPLGQILRAFLQENYHNRDFHHALSLLVSPFSRINYFPTFLLHEAFRSISFPQALPSISLFGSSLPALNHREAALHCTILQRMFDFSHTCPCIVHESVAKARSHHYQCSLLRFLPSKVQGNGLNALDEALSEHSFLPSTFAKQLIANQSPQKSSTLFPSNTLFCSAAPSVTSVPSPTPFAFATHHTQRIPVPPARLCLGVLLYTPSTVENSILKSVSTLINKTQPTPCLPPPLLQNVQTVVFEEMPLFSNFLPSFLTTTLFDSSVKSSNQNNQNTTTALSPPSLTSVLGEGSIWKVNSAAQGTCYRILLGIDIDDLFVSHHGPSRYPELLEEINLVRRVIANTLEQITVITKDCIHFEVVFLPHLQGYTTLGWNSLFKTAVTYSTSSSQSCYLSDNSSCGSTHYKNQQKSQHYSAETSEHNNTSDYFDSSKRQQNCEYFFQVNDDVIFHTKGWMLEAISYLQSQHNVGVTGPADTNPSSPHIITQALLHTLTHAQIFGAQLYPGVHLRNGMV